MPRDTDRPDPSLTTPLGPPIRQAAPAPAPAPSKSPQPGQMDVSDIGMIMRDCTPKPAKPGKLNEQQRADWLRMSAGPVSPSAQARRLDQDARNRAMTELMRRVQDATTPELHPRRHLDWPVIDMVGVTRADFECEWKPSEKDNKLHELAKRYHNETEAYDRTVCTGPVVRGAIQPFRPWEMAAINRYARQVFDRIAQEAATHDISRAELWHAVSKRT